MTIDPKYIDKMNQFPIFDGMNDEERKRLLGIASVERFESGDEVLAQGKDGRSFWIQLEGQCDVIRQTTDGGGCAIVLARFEAPAHFGEMSFFHHAPHSASVRAVSPIEVLRFERSGYTELLESGELAAYKLALNVVNGLAA